MQEKVYDRVFLKLLSRLQAERLDKSGFQYECCSINFWIAYFGTFQNCCFHFSSHDFARHHVFVYFCIGVYLSLHLCVNCNFTFKQQSPFDIPEAYSEPSQISKVVIFAGIFDNYIFKKLHLTCLTGFLIRLCVLNIQVIVVIKFIWLRNR